MRQVRISAAGLEKNWKDDLRSQIPDPRCQMPDPRSQITDRSYWTSRTHFWDLVSEICDLSGFYRFPECCDPLPTGSLQQAHHTHVTKPKEEQREKRNRSPHVQANRIKNG